MAAVAVDGGVQDPEGKEQGKKQDATLDFQRPDCGLLSNLLGRISWEEWREDRSSKAG